MDGKKTEYHFYSLEYPLNLPLMKRKAGRIWFLSQQCCVSSCNRHRNAVQLWTLQLEQRRYVHLQTHRYLLLLLRMMHKNLSQIDEEGGPLHIIPPALWSLPMLRNQSTRLLVTIHHCASPKEKMFRLPKSHRKVSYKVLVVHSILIVVSLKSLKKSKLKVSFTTVRGNIQ